MTPFAGAVLTGGASRRMGVDKATLVVRGQALAATAAAALAEAGARSVHAVGGDASALAGLGLEVWPDDHPGEGPLGGLLTALRRAEEDLVVVVSCDLPDLDAATVAALAAALEARPDAHVAAPVAGGRLQVLTAAYRVGAAPVLRAAFGAGERSVRRAAAGLVVAEVPGLEPVALADVDRPEDLRRYAPEP